MWACGVVLFAMVVGSYPFDFGYHGGVGPEQKGQNAQLMKALMKADYKLPNDISAPLTDLISHLIQPDPDARYTASQALKHPWCLSGGPDGTADRTEADIDAMEAGMSKVYIETPEGDNPEVWLEKIKGAGVDAAAAAEPEAVDVDFDDDEEAGF
jgi:serine/threonine protein kinase